MVFIPTMARLHYEPARATNLAEVEEYFFTLAGGDPALRGVDGVLIKAWVDERGRVKRVRAVGPRVAGVVPRLLPWMFNEDGDRLRGLRWLNDTRLLKVATKAGERLRFYPAMLNGCCVAESRLVGLRVNGRVPG